MHVVIGYYGAAVALGLILMTDRSNVLVWPVVFGVAPRGGGLPLANRRYHAGGSNRSAPTAVDRLGLCGVATEIVLVDAALTLLVDWPHHTGEIALAATGLVPLAILAGTVRGSWPASTACSVHGVVDRADHVDRGGLRGRACGIRPEARWQRADAAAAVDGRGAARRSPTTRAGPG